LLYGNTTFTYQPTIQQHVCRRDFPVTIWNAISARFRATLFLEWIPPDMIHVNSFTNQDEFNSSAISLACFIVLIAEGVNIHRMQGSMASFIPAADACAITSPMPS
jgi:hypothetical protein